MTLDSIHKSFLRCFISHLHSHILALLPSSTHLFAFVAALAVIAIVSIGFFTSNLHYKIQILENQLRSKIGEYNFVQVLKSSLTSKKADDSDQGYTSLVYIRVFHEGNQKYF